MKNLRYNKPIDIEEIKHDVLESLQYIKTARKQMGLTVAELSEKAKVSVGVISELENENKKDKKVPSLVNFIAITRALGLSKEFVLDTVLNYNLFHKEDNYLYEIINYLRVYGIHDPESIEFIVNTIEFVKSRVKNKKSTCTENKYLKSTSEVKKMADDVKKNIKKSKV